MSLQVEREIRYLEDPAQYSLYIRSTEPYGEYFPTHIFVTGIFDKSLKKAKKLAWIEFFRQVDYQDRRDRIENGKLTEIIEIPCGRCACHK